MKTKNTKPNTINIHRFIKAKECLDEAGKKKLLKALKLYKESQGAISEDIMDKPERNPIAKTFDTKSDFESYVAQRRGIQMTPKELQSIQNYSQARPTQQDAFAVKYETTDDFGNNQTTVIKKHKEGNQFCWTAFSKHETAAEEGGVDDQSQDQLGENEEFVVDDPIRITKSITFVDDTEGSNILADFLQKLDL